MFIDIIDVFVINKILLKGILSNVLIRWVYLLIKNI